MRIDIGYDNQFNSLSITDALHRAVEAYKLDSADRVIAVTNLEEQVMTVDYTVAGFIDRIERFDDTVLKVGYSNRGLLNSLQYDYDEQTQSAELQSSYTYWNNGQLRYAINEAGTVECTYDAAGRPLTDDGGAPAAVDAEVEYDLDPVGNLTGLLHIGGQYTATYDDAERLETLNGPEGGFDYDYDPASGLLAEITYPGTITATFTDDGLDRLTDITYDTAGNVEWMEFADSRELDLTWNARYQLTAVKVDDVPTESYTYDALGRRVSVTAGATTTYFVYAGIDVIADTDASGNLLRSYVHGPGVDDILAMTLHTGPQAGTYFYLKDHLGSVLALTDDDGAIVESYAYMTPTATSPPATPRARPSQPPPTATATPSRAANTTRPPDSTTSAPAGTSPCAGVGPRQVP